MNTLSVEQEVRYFLDRVRLRYNNQTDSFKRSDFSIWFAEKTVFFLEVKEKRQPYNMSNWPAFAPEPDLFILDDLTVRKALSVAPRAGILVRDNTQSRYHFFSVVDLALMPRVRVNRQINRHSPELKGKWLINLRNGVTATTLESSFNQIRGYVDNLHDTLFGYKPCYGHYVDEQIGSGGIERLPGHWDVDVEATR
jgi:hypothetical protein